MAGQILVVIMHLLIFNEKSVNSITIITNVTHDDEKRSFR